VPPGLIRAWASGKVTIGAACKIPSSLVAESVASVGFDYVYVDQQHGVIDNAELLSMLQVIAAAGAVPVTRVSANDPASINRALDFGAMGVIVPGIETAADAARAVAACRYPPAGVRSHGALRPPSAQSSSDPDDLNRAACILLVETSRGAANIGDIASTEGVDAVMVGPQNLALGLGIELQGNWLSTPELVVTIEQIRCACEQYGVVAGIGASDGQVAAHRIETGFRMVNVGNDLGHMKAGLEEQLVKALGGIRPSMGSRSDGAAHSVPASWPPPGRAGRRTGQAVGGAARQGPTRSTEE
jgi:4-hydroxy-2-oxoheptanedioate aldolase